jgi:hypothetical protein
MFFPFLKFLFILFYCLYIYTHVYTLGHLPAPSSLEGLLKRDVQGTQGTWVNWGIDTFFFFWYWGLNSGLCTCEASALPLEPCLQPFSLVILEIWSHFLPRSVWTLFYFKLPIIAGMAGMCHHTFWYGISQTFCPDWPRTAISPHLSLQSSLGLGECYLAWLLIEMGSCEYLNPWSFPSQPPK